MQQPDLLTIIPAQCGVSLTSNEEQFTAMMKATVVMDTPRVSWSRATKRGKRQPQQVCASSCCPALATFFSFFCFFWSPFLFWPSTWPLAGCSWLAGDALCLLFAPIWMLRVRNPAGLMSRFPFLLQSPSLSCLTHAPFL